MVRIRQGKPFASPERRRVPTLLPALAGIRILELGSSVAGPSAARQLADLGADVIKVEPPEGDTLRGWGPAAPDGTSWWFKSHNRNKRFARFDLHDETDRANVRAIALSCDVLLENFRPGRLAAWGLGYEDLKAENPRIIYASISGFGQDGPYSPRVGFGNIGECMGGLRYITGFPDRAPVRVGISLGDELAALNLVIGVLAALHARDRDGVGDHIDVSLFESCAALLQGALPEYGALGIVREREGNFHNAVAPSGTYPTRDGRYIAIGANVEPIFRRFTALIGRPELADDPNYIGNRARTRNAETLDEIVSTWTRTLSIDEARDALDRADVPNGPVNSIADIVSDPHVRARGFIQHLPDDAGNIITTAAPVPRFRERPSTSDHAARALGADTAAVRADFGLD